MKRGVESVHPPLQTTARRRPRLKGGKPEARKGKTEEREPEGWKKRKGQSSWDQECGMVNECIGCA